MTARRGSEELKRVVRALRGRGPASYIPDRRRVVAVLREKFSVEDLRDLCFVLGTSYERLSADGKLGKTRELVAYFCREDDLRTLVRAIRELRPDIEW